MEGKERKGLGKIQKKKKIVWDNVAGLTVSFCCTLGLVFGFIMLIMLHQSSAGISNTIGAANLKIARRIHSKNGKGQVKLSFVSLVNQIAVHVYTHKPKKDVLAPYANMSDMVTTEFGVY